ncbi:hypothetical protein RYX36_004626, partial [Vicia faba]
ANLDPQLVVRVIKENNLQAMMLETLDVVPGIKGEMLLHCKSLRRFEHNSG